jgi:hypothetical protein
MYSKKKLLMIAVLIAGLLFPGGSAGASPGIQTMLGDDVTISGYSSVGPYVYLFLTGPNLPENGVALHDITLKADQGGFTKVSVDGDDHWTYTWHTGSINGRLDEGTYTVWAVDGPNDRSRLAEADFRTIAVTLGKPYVAVDTTVPGGRMDLQSVPDGASLTVNGEYRGKTPLVISDLSPGTYTITFSRSGFLTQSAQVTVQGGKNSEVVATLQPETGTLFVNSSPPGARVLLDGTFAGLSPVLLENISADDHTIGLEKDGYLAAARQVTVIAGQVNPVEVSLAPVPVSPTTTQAAGLVPAMAGTFLVVLYYAGSRRRNR